MSDQAADGRDLGGDALPPHGRQNRIRRVGGGLFAPGSSGNPGGRPKTAELNRKARLLAEQLLDEWLDKGIDVSLPGDMSAAAKVFETALKFSGAMTEYQRVSTLLAAAKSRAEFSSEREWLLFVKAAAGHVDEAPALELSPPETEQPKEQKP